MYLEINKEIKSRYGSYENIEIIYYNEEGNIHNVNIIKDEN